MSATHTDRPLHASWSPRTWGCAAAALAGSVATLIGIAAAHEPDTILWRASLGGCAAGACAWATAAILASVAKLPDANDELECAR